MPDETSKDGEFDYVERLRDQIVHRAWSGGTMIMTIEYGFAKIDQGANTFSAEDFACVAAAAMELQDGTRPDLLRKCYRSLDYDTEPDVGEIPIEVINVIIDLALTHIMMIGPSTARRLQLIRRRIIEIQSA